MRGRKAPDVYVELIEAGYRSIIFPDTASPDHVILSKNCKLD